MYNTKNQGAFASSQARAKTPNVNNKALNKLHFNFRRIPDLLIAHYGVEGAAEWSDKAFESINSGIDPLKPWAEESEADELTGHLGY